MDYEEYKKGVLRTENVPTDLGMSNEMLLAALQVCEASAGLLDYIKKVAIYRKPFIRENISIAMVEIKLRLQTLAILNTTHKEANTACTLHTPDIRVAHGAIGMFTEAGELLEAVIQSMQTGVLDKVNVAEELGDSDWYKTITHDAIGISEQTSRGKNIAKLEKRYPEKFTTQAALFRDTDSERQVLES